MTPEDMLRRLSALQVLRTGHFQLTSGKHSDKFLLCSQLTIYPQETARFMEELAQKIRAAELNPTVIIGPALGGIIPAYELARILGKKAMFAEKEDHGMALKRGFSLSLVDRVLLVEDVISTGGSLQKVADLVMQSDAELVGVATLFDRTMGRVSVAGMPVISLLQLDIQSWEPYECPLCRQGIPLVLPKQ
ncbi:MAG: orotate phosphoribosyltransferase [Symbiobacteriaceae bacterium]|nr:orotate phosphoribosyltransferase [Symbiobacteriaceae bacterium]